MAQIKSNEKRARTNEKARLNNLRKKSSLKTIMRNFNKAIYEEDLETAQALLPEVQRALDASVSHNIHHMNFANRHKSKAYRKLADLQNN